MRAREFLGEMPIVVLSGRAKSPIRVYCRTRDSVPHWKSVKVYGPNGTDGTIPWGSDKKPIGTLTVRTVNIVQDFIRKYEFLLAALWDKIIDNDQFLNLYDKSLSVGIDIIGKEIEGITQRKGDEK